MRSFGLYTPVLRETLYCKLGSGLARLKVVNCRPNKKFAGPALFCLAAMAAFGQDGPPLAQTPADNGNVPASLIQPIEKAADFVNLYAFYDGTFDYTNNYTAGAAHALFGSVFGGGATATHEWANSALSFNYRGDYRTQEQAYLPGGVEQTGSFSYRIVLTRRLTLSFAASGGTYPTGSLVVEPTTTVTQQFAQTSPIASDFKFLAGTATLGYRQTRRLSYEFSGTYTLSRYTGPYGFGNNAIIGSATALYQLSPRTIVSGTIQNSAYQYQHNAGSALLNTGYLTLSHSTRSHWSFGVSGGVTHNHAEGTYPVTVDLKIGPIILPVTLFGHYNVSSNIPYWAASASRNFKHSVASFSASESVTPGNGIFLASKTFGVGGLYSYSWRRSSISAIGDWSRLTSTAVQVNTVDRSYRMIAFGAGYSYNLFRYIGANVRYDHLTSEFAGISGQAIDNRVYFGLFFTSKNIPVGIF